MAGTGTATIDFGTGSNEAKTTITGLDAIKSTSYAESWVMADTSADHTASDHRYFPVFASLTCGTPVDGVGFTIYARSIEKLTGEWSIRYVWAE